MSQDPRIEAAARQVAAEHGYPAAYFPDGMADVTAKSYREQAARIVSAADKAAIITTQEQLAATPAGTVFIDSYQVHLGGDVYQKAMELNGRGELIPAYWQAGPQGVFTNIKLPARVIHWGTE